MPGMQQFVADWLRAHEPDKWHKRALTAKSYLLQEAEGISRRAKLAWAARRGDVRVANLQHDGIVVTLPSTVPAEGVAAGMTAACSDVLGYEQPVCEKPLAVAAPAEEEALHGSDTAATPREPEAAMVDVSPPGETVPPTSHEPSEVEFGGAQPPSPDEPQTGDEDATESLSVEELARWLDDRGVLAHISPHAAPGWAELYSTAGAGKPGGVWYAVGGSWIRFCAAEMASWLADSPYVYALVVDRSPY